MYSTFSAGVPSAEFNTAMSYKSALSKNVLSGQNKPSTLVFSLVLLSYVGMTTAFCKISSAFLSFKNSLYLSEFSPITKIFPPFSANSFIFAYVSSVTDTASGIISASKPDNFSVWLSVTNSGFSPRKSEFVYARYTLFKYDGSYVIEL